MGFSRASVTICVFRGGLLRLCYHNHLFLKNYYFQFGTPDVLFVSLILSGSWLHMDFDAAIIVCFPPENRL